MRGPGGEWLSLAKFIAGAEIENRVSAVQFNDLDLSERIDAEYFLPVFLRIATALRGKGKNVEELARLTCSAFYPAATHLYEEGDVPFLRCVDVINYPTITSDQPFVRIPKQFVEDNHNVRTVKTGDIVITKVGTPCFAGIVDESLGQAAMSRTVLGLTNIDTNLVDPYYLIAFLRSDYGFFQLMREREQQIQLQLTLDRVGKVDVFLPSLEVQREIGDIMRQQHEAVQKSKGLYQEAETMLLEALGLDSLDLSPQHSYTASTDEVFNSDRFDAEYYHPEKRHILEQLARLEGEVVSYHFQPVKILVDAARMPPSQELVNYDLTDALRYFLDDDLGERTTAGELGSTKVSFKKNDVVVSRLRSYLREIAVVRTEDDTTCVGSSEFYVFRPKGKVKPELLVVYLRSTPIQKVLKWCQNGSNHPRFEQSEIVELKLPDKLLDIQDDVVKKIDQGIKAHKEGLELLESAKARVEALILRGE